MRARAFGYSLAWIAVREDRHSIVASRLGLSSARPSDWEEAVDTALDGGVLISPPIEGVGGTWVLVTSAEFTGLDVRGLSEVLKTEVQVFERSRVQGVTYWARADSGRVIREHKVAESGEVLVEVGQPTALEWEPLEDVEADRVGQVAAAWSLDPGTLEGREIRGVVLTGEEVTAVRSSEVPEVQHRGRVARVVQMLDMIGRPPE